MATGQTKRRSDIEILPLSYEEVMRNLDQYRQNKLSFDNLTKKQKTFLLKCRTGDQKVSFPTMKKLWAKLGWGDVSKDCMNNWSAKLLK